MKRLLLAAFLALTVTAPLDAAAYSYLYTCGPAWATLPVPYWINSAGSADLPFSTVQRIVADSYAEWGKPCCSDFAAAYQGTTSLTATNNQGRVVHSWQESGAWDPSYGSVNSTIGVTLAQVFNNCTIAEAPIIYNGIGFRFSDGGGATDLASIVTHEIGHSLGLGHTGVSDQATMYPAYIGGTGARSLHQDDVTAVCSLYAQSCSCSSNAQCFNGNTCVGGLCTPPPCQSAADCDAGLSCLPNGDCGVPPCNSDADCDSNYSCEGSRCVASCASCRRNCVDQGDCGSNGFCDTGSAICFVLCGQNAECPGDSVCYIVDDGNGGDTYVCGAPDASATGSLCPEDYVCEDDGITHECNAVSDCAMGEFCVNTTLGRRCQMPEDRCADITCGDGLYCDNGVCLREDISNNVPGNNTPGNNTAGNNTPGNNTPGNNNVGNNGAGGDDPLIVVFADNDEPDEGCCSVTRPREVPSGMLLLIGGLLWARRRRR